MAQQRLDYADVRAGLQKMGGEAVAQGVGRDVLVQVGGLTSDRAGVVQGLRMEGPVTIPPHRHERSEFAPSRLAPWYW